MADFITIFGRLLGDGGLRDEFAADPLRFAQKCNLNGADADALCRLSPAELEVQATVLLRKRFDSVRRSLPLTCVALGAQAWRLFHRYGRAGTATNAAALERDGLRFAEYLAHKGCPALDRRELNRLRFVGTSRRCQIHLVTISARARARRGLQILTRGWFAQPRETVFYFGW